MAKHQQFTDALKQARLAEAAHVDALLNVKEARALRLSALRGMILPELSGHPLAQGFTELSIQSGSVPRLWIDLISSVVVEPDTRHFRLEQDQDGQREVLHETDNIDEMSRVVLKYIAHRVVAREKVSAVRPLSPATLGRYNLWELGYAWLSGAVMAASALFIIAILLDWFNF